MTRTRQNDRLRNALSLLLCLQQVSGPFRKVGRRSAAAPRGTRRRASPGPGGAGVLGDTVTARPSGVPRPCPWLVSSRSKGQRTLAAWPPHAPRTDRAAETPHTLPPGSGDCGLRPVCQWEGAGVTFWGGLWRVTRLPGPCPHVAVGGGQDAWTPSRHGDTVGGRVVLTPSAPQHLPGAPGGEASTRGLVGAVSPLRPAPAPPQVVGRLCRAPLRSEDGKTEEDVATGCHGVTGQVDVCAHGLLGGWGCCHVFLLREWPCASVGLDCPQGSPRVSSHSEPGGRHPTSIH